jgi:hypothetical protein
MALTPAGYSHLVIEYALPARELDSPCYIDSGASSRRDTMRAGQHLFLFGPSYLKNNSLIEHLEFALRYEGPNLEVLALLFTHYGKAEIERWLVSRPRADMHAWPDSSMSS